MSFWVLESLSSWDFLNSNFFYNFYLEFEFLSSWVLEFLSFWVSEFLSFWVFEFLSFLIKKKSKFSFRVWNFEFLSFWISEFLSFRVFEFPSFWVSKVLRFRNPSFLDFNQNKLSSWVLEFPSSWVFEFLISALWQLLCHADWKLCWWWQQYGLVLELRADCFRLNHILKIFDILIQHENIFCAKICIKNPAGLGYSYCI